MIRHAFLFALAGLSTAAAVAAETNSPSSVKVRDGVVQPRRPVVAAITDAMQFLRKADGSYVPGRMEDDLAGYFSSCLVQPDGTRHPKPLLFPSRQHGYFIRTFLHYYAYTGEREYLQRAIDLAQWNIARTTPADSKLPNLPYSAYANGKPMGNADKNSTEPDKAAFIGTWFLALHESTGDAQYLEAARRIAATLVKTQRPDGSWPFRVVPETLVVYEDFGGAPVFFVEFFERLQRHDDEPEYRRARDAAARYMIATNVEKGEWGNYHEDVSPRPRSHITAEHMSFTADYLFRAAKSHPEYIEMGRRVLRQMEAKLVHTEGHSASPAAGVAEQPTFAHIMPGHTARYAQALMNLHLATGDEAPKRRALSSFNAVTYMQSPAGLFRTFFYDTGKKIGQGRRPAGLVFPASLHGLPHARDDGRFSGTRAGRRESHPGFLDVAAGCALRQGGSELQNNTAGAGYDEAELRAAIGAVGKQTSTQSHGRRACGERRLVVRSRDARADPAPPGRSGKRKVMAGRRRRTLAGRTLAEVRSW